MTSRERGAHGALPAHRLRHRGRDDRRPTGRVLSRHTHYDANLTRAVLELCAQACRSCGDECAEHAEHAEHGMEHCRACAEACRRCEQACRDLLAGIG